MESLAGAAMLTLALAVIGGYLLGSIPFGMIATRVGGVGDIRSIGSGNIGATNVLRSGRKDLALITLLGDAGKGALAVLLARYVTNNSAAVVALAGGAAFVGHLFPVWLGFKGGKGVATFFGVLLAAAWPVGLVAGAAWIAVAALFRISSLAALTAAAAAPLIAWSAKQPQPIIWLTVFMAVLIYIRHRENIARLFKGEEPRIGGKKGA
ncbi:MAG TPA: glycerol-3-phosphate 1-O-acyltransferase PlsY [Caulobacteraceae bacterium]|nr:glycerol-3-phosphate 1-O-acyltransferase PlsY [Caulobacteraceae bacterium]